MKWLKNLINKIFNRKDIKLIESNSKLNERQDEKDKFLIGLKKEADVERDDRNGYNISKELNLKDMI